MSEMILENKPLALASPEHCMTWTAEARQLFQLGAVPYKRVLQTPVLALQNLHHASGGAELTMYLAAHPWTDRRGRPGSLVSLYVATDHAIAKAHIEALGRPLQGTSWQSDGIHGVPEYAFPCLGMRDGQLLHLWVEDPDLGLVCTLLGAHGPRVKAEVYRFSDVSPDRFLDHAGHAKGSWALHEAGDRQLREQLKLAFAYRVAERVIEADGRIEDDERAFLARTFPDAQLAELWLDDVGLRDQLAEQAETELGAMLGYHEKLGLLSTFFGACYADGNVAVQELKVLRDASAALGLDRSEVAAYLQKLW